MLLHKIRIKLNVTWRTTCQTGVSSWQHLASVHKESKCSSYVNVGKTSTHLQCQRVLLLSSRHCCYYWYCV